MYDAAWYDVAYKEYPPYADTPMRAMYEHAARRIPRLSPVIDLGCGSGYLASALQEVNYAGKYTGYDYSPVALELARGALTIDNPQLSLFENIDELTYFFEQVDLYDWKQTPDANTHKQVVTCFEVLEHLQDDCAIVDMVPARSKFIFSVPNYWSRSHVRTYDSVGVAFNRYGNWLEFKSWKSFPTKQEGAAINVYNTVRRSDKW